MTTRNADAVVATLVPQHLLYYQLVRHSVTWFAGSYALASSEWSAN